MGKKKKEAASNAKAATKAAKKIKIEKKAEKKDTKIIKKKKDPDEDSEDDLEAILDKMAREWEATHQVTEETVAGPPSRRANSTLTPCPIGNHLWCIGGEFFSEDGKAHFYNDVYRYSPEKDEWRKYTSPTAPGPRSAHSVVASPAAGGKLFLVGGEFSSLHQNTFHHYRDLWVFDIPSRSWERIDTKLRPSARSGHRMALWKHFIVLFGGFFDLGVRTNYLNDTWLFDTLEYKWISLEFKDNDRKPSPRSGFSFLPLADGILLYGGYCKEYIKGSRPAGVALDDTWFLRMAINTKEIKWEKLKRSSSSYQPSKRSGCSMALWAAKAQGILFGGVSDTDKDEERMDSVFYNDMYGYQTSGKGRWVSMTLKKKKNTDKKGKTPSHKVASSYSHQQQSSRPLDDEDDEDFQDVERYRGASMKTQQAQVTPTDPELPLSPFPRYNATTAVLKNTLFVYGGIYEQGSKEYSEPYNFMQLEQPNPTSALDDFWSIQLDKMDEYVCLRPLGVVIGQDEASSSEDDDDDDGEDDEDDEEDDDDDYDEERATDGGSSGDGDGDDDGDGDIKDEVRPSRLKEPPVTPKVTEKKKQIDLPPVPLPDEVEKASEVTSDPLSTPLPGETLAGFYGRTREFWSQKAHVSSDNRGKMLRKDGFALAKERYEAYKPILEQEERILEEAGLDHAEMRLAGGGSAGNALGVGRNRR